MEAGHARKTNHVRIQVLSHVVSPRPIKKAGALEIEHETMASDSIHHAYVMKPQQKL